MVGVVRDTGNRITFLNEYWLLNFLGRHRRSIMIKAGSINLIPYMLHVMGSDETAFIEMHPSLLDKDYHILCVPCATIIDTGTAMQ